MENASKALIIAGAILLAIAIIGIGMYVFSSASSQVGDANLSKEQIQVFNSKFERFEGEQSGKQVKLLIDTLRNHNLAQDSYETMIRVRAFNNDGTLAGSYAASSDIQNNLTEVRRTFVNRFTKSKIMDSQTYKIGFIYNEGTKGTNNKGAIGTISWITISPNPGWDPIV